MSLWMNYACSDQFMNTHYCLFLDLENLVELDLSLNFLSSVPIGALSQLRNLKFLNLGSNRIQVSELCYVVYYVKD